MTRPPVLLLATLGLASCDERPADPAPPPVRARREAVMTSARAAAPSATEAATPSARAEPRRLCAGRPSGKVPEGRLATRAAPGAGAPPTPIPFGAGKWIWLNLWAAWCVPCKAEMPLLIKWRDELRKAGVLVDLAFVSIDDDERELARFLTSQPEAGVRASYWLPDARRERWLAALGVGATPRLPVHALVSPRGELACVIDGAVEEGDFARLAAVLRAPGGS
jgi:thiol-disulfide isomerase/thioredoxin